MARLGRPLATDEGPRRTERRTARVTPEEAAQIDALAASAELTVSDYMRAKALGMKTSARPRADSEVR